MGEPYLLDYQKQIEHDVALVAPEGSSKLAEYIPNHVLVGVIEL